MYNRKHDDTVEGNIKVDFVNDERHKTKKIPDRKILSSLAK